MYDQRKAERLPVEGSLTGDITVAMPLVVTQISAGGVLVETERPLRLESLHEVRLSVDGAVLVISGRVVHSRVVDLAADILVYESGLEFINPSLHAQNALRTLLLRLNGGGAPA